MTKEKIIELIKKITKDKRVIFTDDEAKVKIEIINDEYNKYSLYEIDEKNNDNVYFMGVYNTNEIIEQIVSLRLDVLDYIII